MGELRLTKVRDLILIAVVFVALGWLLAREFYASLPAIQLLVGLPLAVLAVGEVVLARHLRRRIGGAEVGAGLHQTDPITVARSAMLGKASALVGALVAGIFGGLLIYLSTDALRLHAAALDRPGVIIAVVSGLALAAAGAWLERACLTPPQSPGPGASHA